MVAVRMYQDGDKFYCALLLSFHMYKMHKEMLVEPLVGVLHDVS